MTALILDPRGMDFYKGCPEKGNSDFDNFRYFAEMPDGHGGAYFFEITIHWRDQYKRVNAFIEYSHNYFDGMCYRVGVDIVEPYKKAVLEAINKRMNTDFDEIKIELGR